MDIYINPSSRDLWIGDAGQTRLTSGVPEAAAQRIAITLLMFAGEWFLDLTAGVNYYRDVLVKNPDLSAVRALFRAKVADDPYVVDVPRMDLTFDTAARTISISFDARLREGSEIQILIEEGVIDGGLVVTGIQIVINGVPVMVNG